MSDRGEYSETGGRGADPRRGFGDDMGTRIGRPDGASDATDATDATDAKQAPHDASTEHRPGDPSTNSGAVADGLEGSIEDEGPQQERVQRASRGDVTPDPAAGDERRVDDL